MKNRFSPLLVLLVLTFSAFACTLPFATPQPSGDQVATVVAATLQALTPSASAGESPTSAPAGLLPHSLYFLNNDSTGVAQVYRLEVDGQTLRQITFEPSAVGAYDVSPVNGRVAYVANNQLLLIDANGADRRVLVDGGPVDENNPILNSVSNPIFSPDGQTIAYGHKGLNLYAISAGVSTLVLEKQIVDPITSVLRPGELYWPGKYSPDGTKLIITAAIPNSDGIFDAIFYPATKSLVTFQGDDVFFICCGDEEWTLDSLSFYSAMPTVGMWGSGLWRVDAASGAVTTLIPGDAGGGIFNLADEPYPASDGQLYFFFATASSPDGMIQRAPLQIVRSAPDGVTGRTVLRPETFETLNEALWAPDASFVITAKAPTDSVYAGGVIDLYYTDAAEGMISLVPFGQQLKWGP